MGKVDIQSVFSRKISVLIQVAHEMGYQVTLDESYNASKTGHMAGSLHYERLAQDLNLFKDGKYLSKTSDHMEIITPLNIKVESSIFLIINILNLFNQSRFCFI
jgi:hypothetical protein